MVVYMSDTSVTWVSGDKRTARLKLSRMFFFSESIVLMSCSCCATDEKTHRNEAKYRRLSIYAKFAVKL